MFTGLVETTGTVEGFTPINGGARLTLIIPFGHELSLGDSVAVNGCCLTVDALDGERVSFDLLSQTLRVTSLGNLQPGGLVNLERAMAADGRFGGHIVAGHVDGVGRISHIRRDDNAIWYTIQTQPALLRYVVEKGSITVDGISLTVATVGETSFSISAIPHTVRQTVLHHRRKGDLVNLETDIIGKYIEKLLQPAAPQPKESTITRDLLSRCGF